MLPQFQAPVSVIIDGCWHLYPPSSLYLRENKGVINRQLAFQPVSRHAIQPSGQPASRKNNICRLALSHLYPWWTTMCSSPEKKWSLRGELKVSTPIDFFVMSTPSAPPMESLDFVPRSSFHQCLIFTVDQKRTPHLAGNKHHHCVLQPTELVKRLGPE